MSKIDKLLLIGLLLLCAFGVSMLVDHFTEAELEQPEFLINEQVPMVFFEVDEDGERVGSILLWDEEQNCWVFLEPTGCSAAQQEK